MKKIISFFGIAVCLLVSSSFKINSLTNIISSPKTEIEVIFNHTLNFNDMVKLKSDLSQQQIILTYRKLEFDENGKLTSIEFTVFSEGNYCGKGTSKILADNSRFGFAIDKDKNAPVYFRVGNI